MTTFKKLQKNHRKTHGARARYGTPLCHPCSIEKHYKNPGPHFVQGVDMCDKHYEQLKALGKEHGVNIKSKQEKERDELEAIQKAVEEKNADGAGAGDRVDEDSGQVVQSDR